MYIVNDFLNFFAHLYISVNIVDYFLKYIYTFAYRLSALDPHRKHGKLYGNGKPCEGPRPIHRAWFFMYNYSVSYLAFTVSKYFEMNASTVFQYSSWYQCDDSACSAPFTMCFSLGAAQAL